MCEIDADVARTRHQAAALIDQAVMRDGEHPSAQRSRIVGATWESAHDGHEHVAEKVFGFGRSRTAQIPEHRGRELAVEALESLARLEGGRGGRTHASIVRRLVSDATGSQR